VSLLFAGSRANITSGRPEFSSKPLKWFRYFLFIHLYVRNKEKPLRRANLGLEVVRHLWRLAYELKAVAIRQYEHGAKLMDELGRQIGGWLRSTRQSQPNI
jgi:hypothetical protein